MRNMGFLALLFMLLPLHLIGQTAKHSIFVAANFNIAIKHSLYIDFDMPDFEIWEEPLNHLSSGFGYTYMLNDYFGIGGQLEYEKIKFKHYFMADEAVASRYMAGFHFQTMYPATSLHATTGGYCNLGQVNSDEFDNKLQGIEYGIFLGPSYRIDKAAISMLFHPKFSYYFAKGDSPNSGLLMYPRITLRVAYTF